MSWVAIGVTVAGAAVSAGTQAYSANKAKKAAGQQSAALNNMEQLEPVPLGDPAQIDMRKLSLDAIDIPFDRLEYANRLSSSVNRQNYREAIKYYRRIQPFFDALQKQTGSNALSFARGELPADVQSQIQRAAAEKGIQGGFGFGSQGAQQGSLANLNLRNLGLTSLDLSRFGTQMGMQVNQQARQLLPNLTSPMDFLFNPAQFLQAETQNVGAQNQFLLRNNELANQAAMQNTSLANSVTQSQAQMAYQQSLADAQQTAAIGSAIGGALSGSAGLFGGGAGAGAATGAGGAGGMTTGEFMGRTNTQGIDLSQLY